MENHNRVRELLEKARGTQQEFTRRKFGQEQHAFEKPLSLAVIKTISMLHQVPNHPFLFTMGELVAQV